MKEVLKATLASSILATALHAAGPVTVSPGEADRLSFVEVRCPTFSWGLVPGAGSYSVSVFALDGTGAPESVPVLQKEVPAGVTSWTPSLGSCLVPGSRYAWVVSAEEESTRAQSAASEPLFFAIAERPAPGELGAISALPNGSGLSRKSPTAATDSLGAQPAGTHHLVSPAGMPPGALSLTSLEAGVRAEVVDTTTGSGVVGVAGIADSTLGAGLYAANLSATGADLVLDGSAQGVSDTVVTESGVVAGGGAFEFTNASGTLDLHLNGTSVTTEATDDDTLADLVCAGASKVAKWDGTQWLCGDGAGLANVTASALGFEVTGSDVADGSLGSADIADGAIGGTQVLDGSLTGDDIADGSIEGVDIANGTITGSDIGFQQITGIQIASDAINSNKIANGTVNSSDIADGQVFTGEIADGTILSVDIADGSITRDDIADGTLTGIDIADGTILSADIGNGTITRSDILDEAGVEFTGVSLNVVDLEATPKVIESLTITAPTAGYLVVTASAVVSISPGASYSVICRLTTGTTVEVSNWQVIVEAFSSTDFSIPIALTRGFPVGAGQATVNLVCRGAAGHDPFVHRTSMTGVFASTRY